MRGELSQFVDEMVVTEAMINHILETKVTERGFLEQLQELNQKINFVKEQSFKETRSVRDVEGVIEKLKIKVSTQSASTHLNLHHIHGCFEAYYRKNSKS